MGPRDSTVSWISVAIGARDVAEQQEDMISAHPTKDFFVEMITRDISLQEAVLDLIDNCVDGAKRLRESDNQGFSGLRVDIKFSEDRFVISDNCGGFSKETARDYAFRFGRPKGFEPTSHSIGQFGVGMKRALFKMGLFFVVESKHESEHWAVEVDVGNWQTHEDWTFPWADPSEGHLEKRDSGTYIEVMELREGTASSFGSSAFSNNLISAINTKHREFISAGLEIFVNGLRVDASDLKLYDSIQFSPVVEIFDIKEGGDATVTVRIIVGVGGRIPGDAGWCVVCNGRVILDADKRPEVGWNYVEENVDLPTIPKFHNQFARFRGIVYFDSDNASRVPWDTTKADIDVDSVVWKKAFKRMIVHMRTVIDFLNELDQEIDDYGQEKSPISKMIRESSMKSASEFTSARSFRAPKRSSIEEAPPLIKIQYSKPVEEINTLKEAYNLNSARSVGEKTFDLALERQRG